nr:MAG TPA: hypothetical protein [Caudoviricetes sp.]
MYRRFVNRQFRIFRFTRETNRFTGRFPPDTLTRSLRLCPNWAQKSPVSGTGQT